MPFEKVELPSGAWAALRDPEQTTEAQREPVSIIAVRAAASSLWAALRGETPIKDVSDEEIIVVREFQRVLAAALIEEWSFDLPITVDGLKTIPGRADYDALIEATGKHRDALLPDFGPSDDPESPTEASDA